MGSSPFRSFADRQFDPPPTTGQPDELDRTARQVRTLTGLVHRLALATTYDRIGRMYTTDCGRTLYAADDAMLTAADVTCTRCNGTAVTP